MLSHGNIVANTRNCMENDGRQPCTTTAPLARQMKTHFGLTASRCGVPAADGGCDRRAYRVRDCAHG